MANNTVLSSSEQYVKKTNRRILIFGIVALLAFLFGLLMLTSTSKKAKKTDDPIIVTGTDPLVSDNKSIVFDTHDKSAVELSAYPENVSMTNVVLGSSAQAIVTLTAKGGPIRLESMDLAAEQQDGFIIAGECKVGEVIAQDASCNMQVLWNPVSIRSYSNYLTIRWRYENSGVFPLPEQKSLIVNITGQSTDSKDCVICETKEANKIAEQMGKLDPQTGLYIKDNEIMGIVELDKIAISNNGTLLGRVTKDTKEVVNDAGEVLGRVLGDNTVVTKELEVLGGALPLASVLDSSGQVIGKLIEDGTVVDADGKLLGLPMADGSVVSAEGSNRLIGSVMPWAVVLNLSSKAVGGTQMDGTVLLANGQVMGRVLPGGLVVNESGAIVGGTVSSGLGVGSACHSLGKVAENGKIYNAFNQQVGYTTIDGLVMDMSGVPAGQVIREGVIINLKGEVTAFVNSEGKAVAADANLIGCVNPDTSVSSGKGIIGSVMPRGRVIGYDTELKGVVLPNGSAVNPVGEPVGSVLSSGYVVDMNEQTLGAVIPKGTAVAPGCVFLGILDLNGRVIDQKGAIAGVMNPDKKILNKDREIIGGVTPLGAVAGIDGKFLGYVLPTGKVVDRTGQVIGCVNPDGTVVNEKGEIIGKVVDAGVVLDANGLPTDLKGNVVNGILVNEAGEIIGFVPPDGIVVSPEGRFLGRFTRKVGYATDAKGNKFGRVLPDYTVVSLEKSEIIGALIPDGTQIIDLKNQRIGSVQANGEVLDLNLKTLGNIRADGSVMDKDGVVLGAAMPTGSVLDWNGKVIGSVQPSGKVVAQSQAEIGVVTLNHTVVDKNGQVVGMVFPEASIPLGENGELVGALTITGAVNKAGKPFAHITAIGNIFANNGESVGSLVRLGSVMGNDGNIKGWVSFDGKVNSKENFEAIGKMMPDGTVVNDKNMQIGHLIPRSTVVDLKGNFAGVASVDGRVLGRTGEVLGSFPYDDRLMNDHNIWVGRILDAGVALDNAGQLLGYTRYDASVVNAQAQIIGRVRSDNRVMNSKNEVIGQYVPYGQLMFDQKGKVLGAVSFDGKVRDGKGSEIGLVIGSTLTNKADEILGNPFNQGFALDEQGNVTGHIFPNAKTFQDIDGVEEANVLTTSLRLVNKNKEIVGGAVPFGVALSLDLSSAGNLIGDGSVLQGTTFFAKSLSNSILYDSLDKVSGGITAPSIMVGRDGRVVGTTSVSSSVNDLDDKKIGLLLPFGTSLNVQNNLVGMTMPQGAAVDDFAKVVGLVSSDGSVVKADGAMVGRVMQDGTIVRLLSRDAYGVMPDFADVIASGVAIGLKPELFGRAMPSGDVLDVANKKNASILDDATLLGLDGNIAGALVGFRTAIDYDTVVMGNATGDGFVTSIKGEKIGHLASNGAVKGKHQLKTLGAIVPKELVAKQCRVQGQVRYDGKIIDGNAKVVGTIGLDGMAKDENGKSLGGVVLKGTVIADGEKGEVLGRTLPDADVVNMQGVSIGCALEDGTVIDHDGNTIGHVLKRGIVVDDNGNVIGRVLRNGEVINANGEVVGHVLADGSVVDGDGKVIGHVIDIKKNHVLYNDKGDIVGSMDKAGRVFDTKGRHLFTVSPDDKIYDPNGNLIGTLDADGNIFDLAGNKIGDAMNLPHYIYDANGNVTGYIKDSKLFDLDGNQTGWIDQNGNIYDMNGNLIGKINPDGSITMFENDNCVNAKYNGEVRDLNGDLLYTIKCGKIYDPNGNLIGYIDANGNMYDLKGNYLGRIGEDGVVYDANGNVIGKWKGIGLNADINCVNAKYNGEVRDLNGDLLYTIKCGKIYDKDGNLIGYIDENGKMYDLKGNYLGRIGEDGVVYDANGNVIGKWKGTGIDANCTNAKYNGKVHDNNGNLLYTIKCGKIYDANGNLIGYIDENGKMYGLNGEYLGRIDENGNVYDANDNLVGKWRPDSANGFVSGVKNLLGGSSIGMAGTDLAGRKIAIGDKSYVVMPDNTIVDAKGAIVGQLRNGVPYSLSGNLLADEIGVGAAGANGSSYPQEQLQFDPNQGAAIRELLARRRAEMKKNVSKTLAKITPDGRVLARAKQKQSKDFGSKTVSSWPVDMTRMILKDKAIPAVLVRSIDSRYMNVPASAIVERNIYAEDGRNIVIPAGSKLIGHVSGSPGTNHVAKMEISWERLIRPDGGQFTMNAVSGDAQGRGGVAAYLDEMWLAKYGKPVLASSVTSAIAYVTARDESVTTNQDYGTQTESDRAKAAQDARENFIDDMEMIFQQMIEDSSSTPPVVFVPSGTRLTVFAMDDLWLRNENDDEDDYVNEYGKDPTSAFSPLKGGMQTRPTGGLNQGVKALPSDTASTPDEVAGAEDEYYDPGYTGDDESEEIYTPQSEKTETTKSPTLEEMYSSRSGLSNYKVKADTAKPLEQTSSKSKTSSDLF